MSVWRRLFRAPEPEKGDEVDTVAGEAELGRHATGESSVEIEPAGSAAVDPDQTESDILEELADAQAELVERVDQVLAEVAKLGREQFRATTLLEGHDTVLEELAEAWREEQDRREAGAIQERLARSEIEAQARLGVVKELLPVADALDASVRAARELLAAPSPSTTPAPPAPPSWLARLLSLLRRRAWLAWPRLPTPPPAPAAPVDDRANAIDTWLRGLLLTEERLRALLDREGVRPMRALGEPFDPHRHLAVAVSDAAGAPDGTIVAEDLRGYTAGDRVLRHAEVVVARAASTTSRSESETE